MTSQTDIRALPKGKEYFVLLEKVRKFSNVPTHASVDERLFKNFLVMQIFRRSEGGAQVDLDVAGTARRETTGVIAAAAEDGFEAVVSCVSDRPAYLHPRCWMHD